MRRMLLFIVLIYILSASCHTEISNGTISKELLRDTFVLIKPNCPLDTCLAPSLKECMVSYILSNNNEGNWWYYYAYFFQKDSLEYFTIWFDEDKPDNILKGKDSKIHFDYYWFQLLGKDVIFIKNHDDQRILPFKPCISLIKPEDIKYIPCKEVVIRDGFAFRTFQYYFNEGKYHLGGRRDTIYLNKIGYVRMGMRNLKRENESLKLNPYKLYPVYE